MLRVCVFVCVPAALYTFPNISAERKVHLLIMHSANESSPPLDIQSAGNVNSCRMLKRCFHHADVSGGCSFLSACSRNISPSVAVAGHTQHTHTEEHMQESRPHADIWSPEKHTSIDSLLILIMIAYKGGSFFFSKANQCLSPALGNRPLTLLPI